MSDLLKDGDFFHIQEKLPEIGQRVVTIILKEMIYMGNADINGSEWMDDGEGERAIMAWKKIKNTDENNDR